MKAENRKQLVRGVVEAGSRSTYCVAKTFWYRHDELNKVESALKVLETAYSRMSGFSELSSYYEYKDYEQ